MDLTGSKSDPFAHWQRRRKAGELAAPKEDVIERIRIVVADLSQLAADVVDRAIAEQPDMVVVGRRSSLAGLLELAHTVVPQVVIVGVSEPRVPPECCALLARTDRLMVIGIEATVGRAHLYELRRHHDALGAVTADELIDVLRNATRPSVRPLWPGTPRSQR
jgi:chemotaxis response regulator CheB